MRLRYTPRAFADSGQIFSYLAAKSPVGARNVMTSIALTVDRLLDQPLAGYMTDVADVRVLFVGRYPYKVFYRVRGDAIEILHLRHTSRRIPYSF